MRDFNLSASTQWVIRIGFDASAQMTFCPDTWHARSAISRAYWSYVRRKRHTEVQSVLVSLGWSTTVGKERDPDSMKRCLWCIDLKDIFKFVWIHRPFTLMKLKWSLWYVAGAKRVWSIRLFVMRTVSLRVLIKYITSHLRRVENNDQRPKGVTNMHQGTNGRRVEIGWKRVIDISYKISVPVIIIEEYSLIPRCFDCCINLEADQESFRIDTFFVLKSRKTRRTTNLRCRLAWWKQGKNPKKFSFMTTQRIWDQESQATLKQMLLGKPGYLGHVFYRKTH